MPLCPLQPPIWVSAAGVLHARAMAVLVWARIARKGVRGRWRGERGGLGSPAALCVYRHQLAMSCQISTSASSVESCRFELPPNGALASRTTLHIGRPCHVGCPTWALDGRFPVPSALGRCQGHAPLGMLGMQRSRLHPEAPPQRPLWGAPGHLDPVASPATAPGTAPTTLLHTRALAPATVPRTTPRGYGGGG